MLTLAAALLVLPAVLLLALRSPSFRQALLRRVGSAIEERSGVRMAADDFQISLRRGELTVRGLELAASGSETPFARAAQGQAGWEWASLLGDPPALESLEVDGLSLDLSAALPAPPEPPEDPGSDDRALLDVARLTIRDATIRSGAISDDLDVWLDAARAEQVDLRGSFVDGRLGVESATARVVIESHRRPTLTAEVEGAGAITADGGLLLDSLAIDGDGLHLLASAAGQIADELAAELVLTATLERLVPDLVPAGSVEVTTRTLRQPGRVQADGELRIHELPVELFEPFLSPTAIARLRLSGSTLHLESDFDLEKSGPGLESLAIESDAAITWRRQSEVLLTAEAEVRQSPAGETVIGLEADVLPGLAGRRRVSGDATVPDWSDATTAELDALAVLLEVDDAATAARQLGLTREAIEHWGLSGEVTVDLRAVGPVLRPRVSGDVRWHEAGSRLLTASVSSAGGLDLQTETPTELAVELDLLPDDPGRRVARGTVRVTSWSEPTGVELVDSRLLLDIVDLSSTSRRFEQRWPALSTGWSSYQGLLVGGLDLELQANGPLTRPDVRFDGSWRPAPDEALELRGRVGVSSAKPFLFGPLEVDARLSRLDLSRLGIEDREGNALTGTVDGVGTLDGLVDEWRARLDVSGTTVSYAGVDLETIQLAGAADQDRVEVERLTAELGESLGGGRLSASLGLALATPVRSAHAVVGLTDPIAGFDRATAELRLDGGTLHVAPLRLTRADQDSIPVVIEAAIPLGGVATLPALAEAFQRLPIELDDGPATLRMEAVDLASFWGLASEAEALRLRGEVAAALSLDLADPTGVGGRLQVAGLELIQEDGRLTAEDVVEVALGHRRATLRPVRWRAIGGRGAEERRTELRSSGEVILDPDWRLGTPWQKLVESVALDLSGAVDSSLLNPFLGGGVGAGRVDVEARLTGSPSSPEGHLSLRGPESTISFVHPYSIRLESPEIDVRILRGRAEIETARARANRGQVSLSGSADREAGIDLALAAEGVRLRVEHGLTLLLRGDLTLTRAGPGTGAIGGDVIVERGSLRRDLRVDRELLGLLFGAAELEGTEAGPLDDVRLDIDVTTLEGVSVRNNIADIFVDWPLLRVRGTIGQPLVRGRFDVEPGGRITAYGQTVRVDQAALILSGDPDIEPRLILETTSSLEDPSLRREQSWYSDTGWGDRGAWDTGFFGPGDTAGTDAVVSGVATHYTERLASALGGALAGTEVSYQPLPIFGERDTQGRWTLIQRLSPRVTFINSRNPREAEGTTNLVALHGFAAAPGVTAQLFNDDDGDPGATLQQTRQLGGGSDPSGAPLLRRVVFEGVDEISARRLRQATGFRRGDPFPEGSDFDVEVDVHDFMLRNGFSNSLVRAETRERSRGLVDVEVEVDAGPRARIVFEGDRPGRAGRRDVRILYRAARLAEEASLEEMRRATVKALRAEGFLDPRVELMVEPEDPADPAGDRTVRVVSVGGRRIAPGPPRFTGIDSAVADQLVALFDTTLTRVELAAAAPGADEFLKRALRRVGHPHAEVLGREISDDGLMLTVDLRPGPLRTVGEVRVTGLPPGELEALRAELPLATGQALRSEALARAVTALEYELQKRGHIDALVEISLGAAEPSGETEVHLAVDAGTSFRVAATRLEGLRSSQPEWAERVARIEPGAVLTVAEIGDARQRLHQTGVFGRIGGKIERGAPPLDGTAADATVVFNVDERPRYSISYGGRWESREGLGGAVYVADRNFLGRGQTLGLRAIYLGSNDRALGLHHAWPRVAGTRNLLEFFVEDSVEVDTGTVVDGVEAWTQLTIPLSRRRQTRFYVQYQDREFEPENAAADALADENARNVYFGWQYVFDGRERAVGHLQDGLFAGVDLSGASDNLGSDFGEARLFGQAKILYPIGRGRVSRWSERRMRWAQSVRIGWLEARRGVIPRVDRLTAGGEFSVRGYRSDSLGPLDEDGAPLGGEVFLILNHELHLPVRGDLDAVLFFDAGNVWESTSTLDEELFTSAGFGFRTPSPIGPLRLDVAFPLDRRAGIDSDYEIYFGFGTSF